jgi:hypothetical protein
MDPAAAPAAPVQLVMDYRTQKIADLPLFHGDSTDTIKPEDFIRKTEAAKEAMRWDDATTTVHFKACLRGNGLDWLKALEFKSINVNDWAIIKQNFKDHFVTPFQEQHVLTALSSMVLKSGEHPREFDSRICGIFIDIKKNRPAFVNAIPADRNLRTDELIQQGYEKAMDHCMHHIIKCFYISGLPKELQNEVIKRKPADFLETTKTTMEIYELLNSPSTSSKPTKVAAVEENVSSEEFFAQNKDDPEVAEALMAIQRRRNGFVRNINQNRGNSYNNGSRTNNHQGYQQQNRNNSTGNNGSRRFCLYCKKDNHNQESCYTRKNKSHCLVDKDGNLLNKPGTREFDIWKKELQAKGKKVMIIDDIQSEPSSNSKTHLN